MSAPTITGQLTYSDVECARRFVRCGCLFELWKADPPTKGSPTPPSHIIAACPTREAHDVARRLLGQQP